MNFEIRACEVPDVARDRCGYWITWSIGDRLAAWEVMEWDSDGVLTVAVTHTDPNRDFLEDH